ncbi:hypothetical protein MBH78_05150 [Oceanimonas sp. NS1]|nr:hypothetical protein [Oceanimonas sp. NS1]
MACRPFILHSNQISLFSAFSVQLARSCIEQSELMKVSNLSFTEQRLVAGLSGGFLLLFVILAFLTCNE